MSISLQKILLPLLVIFLFFFAFIYYQFNIPITNFPVDQEFEIEKNETGEQIFNKLQANGYIRSVFFAKILSKLMQNKKFYPEIYSFKEPLSLHQILLEITKRPVSLAVLIPPGFTKFQVAERLAKYIRHFDKQSFLKDAKEGYLYPETYFFYKLSDYKEVLAEFDKRFYQETFKKFGRSPTKEEVIIASMLEREARDPEDMKIIAGIYKNRLDAGMLLQVDATVLYGKGAWKEKVYYSDLKHESDYNTYQNKGLPVGPISNPGADSIAAAMNPTENEYVYYLTGRDGKMYYAKTHEEHVKNKIKYLR